MVNKQVKMLSISGFEHKQDKMYTKLRVNGLFCASNLPYLF